MGKISFGIGIIYNDGHNIYKLETSLIKFIILYLCRVGARTRLM